MEEGGAVAFFGGGVECELADYEDFSCGIEYAEIHFILIIRKDAEAGDFSAEPIDIRDVVSGFDSKKNEKTVIDGGGGFGGDGDACGGDTLEKGTHGLREKKNVGGGSSREKSLLFTMVRSDFAEKCRIV